MMRKAILTLFALVSAALIAPLAGHAGPERDDGLRVRLEPPVTFGPTADCPDFAAVYGISVRGKTGSGTNCILAIVPADCPPNVTAQFCQTAHVRMTLSLRGSTIEADVTIFEAWTCDTNCAVDQRWSGTVTQATGRFSDLEGGSVSGGGLFVFDAVTGELRVLDEVLVIGEADEDEDDDEDDDD
jgi:hypothetical protein